MWAHPGWSVGPAGEQGGVCPLWSNGAQSAAPGCGFEEMQGSP